MTSATTKGERTQARILEAAVSAFGRGGFRSTPVATIAREAGVSPAAAFSYWPSKESLFEAAVDLDAHAVIDEVLESMSRSSDLDRWLGLVDELVAALERHPLARRVLSGHEPDVIDRVLEVPAFDALRRTLTDVIAASQEAGSTRSDLDPARAAIGMETITLALAMAMLQMREPPHPTRQAGVAEILLAAFRPPT